MKFVIAIAILFAASVLATSDEELFRKFMSDHKKIYRSSEEFTQRLSNFKANLRNIEQLNADPNQQATFAINKYSDMTKEEFSAAYLLPKFDALATCTWPYHATVDEDTLKAAPTSFDWRTKGAVTPVKNQQQCGSCWTFSTSGNIEGQWQIYSPKHQLVGLSEQWSVDCSTGCLQSEPSLCDGGCGGGLPWLAYEDIIKNKGLPTEASYPYIGEDQTCQTGKTIGAVIYNWTAVSNEPKQIEAFLATQGPLSITMNADLLMSYSSGILTGTASSCPNSGSDHAILLVGYGTDSSTKTNYWIVKNSWGTDWGMEGYFQIASDQGLCGINACVTTSLVKFH